MSVEGLTSDVLEIYENHFARISSHSLVIGGVSKNETGKKSSHGHIADENDSHTPPSVASLKGGTIMEISAVLGQACDDI